MLDTNNISPLLDNLLTGELISHHHGIQCYPAVDQENDKKYIVKIISVPASQTQLDALLLTGAVENMDAANKYFQERVADYTHEISVLNELSKYEGYLPYAGYQVVPKEDNTGFHICILSVYRHSLERQLAQKSFTQLDALNLGLDICSALTACRRSGYIFANLKPSNIYVSDSGEYKISDFGFVKLSGLKYATIADHYIGEYSAPELADPFSSLNERIDVYSLGMILYGIYNGGIHPDPNSAASQAPAYADPELAQIIQKACSLQPEDRWESPAQMGQMLVSYMQKNGVMDTPIVPPPPEPDPEELTEELSEELSEELLEELPEESQALSDIPAVSDYLENDYTAEYAPVQEDPIPVTEAPFQQALPTDDIAVIPPAALISDTAAPEQASDYMDTHNAPDSIPASLPDAPVPSEASAPEVEPEPAEEPEPPEADTQEVEPDPAEEPEPPEADTQDTEYEGISDEVSEILSKADSLAAMEVPEPVVAPEARAVTIDVEIGEEEAEQSEDNTENENREEAEMEYYVDVPDEPRKSHLVRNIILIILAIGLLVGGFFFYKLYILQTVDSMTLVGSKDQLTVIIQADIDEKLLTVSCTKVATEMSITAPVINGEANFSGLDPDSIYNIEVKISGLHIIDGEKSKTYRPPEKVEIMDYEVLTGETSGSAVLSFDVSPDVHKKWSFTYSGSGTETKTVVFDGNSVTLTSLIEGKVYTGTLESEDDLIISGVTQFSFTPSGIVKANNLAITGCTGGKLTAQWEAPEAVKVDSWTVRCYNGRDYDKSITTKETQAEFTGLNSESGFTVEVTAAGQSMKQTATIGANSVTVSNITADSTRPGIIDLTWESSATPANGWIITYNVAGCESVTRVAGEVNKAEITPAIPNVTYLVSIRSGDSVQTLCKDFEYTTPKTEPFSLKIGGKSYASDDIQASMCIRPATPDWTYHDIPDDTHYTSKFKLSQEAGLVLYLDANHHMVTDEISIAYVVYDNEDQIMSLDCESLAWNKMWNDRHCYLNIPKLPNAVGKYTVEIYFNGSLVIQWPLTMI